MVERALDQVLPKATPGLFFVQIALSWASFALATAAGFALAAAFRRRCMGSPALRGLSAGAIVWAALDLGAWRTLWFLTPTHASDALAFASVVLTSLLVALLARGLGLRRALLGTVLGSLVALVVAAGLYVTFRTRELGALLARLPLMTIPLVPWVWLWAVFALPTQRCRGERDVHEHAAGVFRGAVATRLRLTGVLLGRSRLRSRAVNA